MKTTLMLMIGIALFLILEFTWADEVKLYEKPPTAEEISQQLFPEQYKADVQTEIKSRSISFGTKKNSLVKTGRHDSGKSDQKPKRTGIGFPIQFGFNSAEILDESDSYLDQIGIMLKMEKNANAKLRIVGHTDTLGTEFHNQILSQARAEAVKNYLISKYDVDPYRLIIVGMGESRPLKNKAPQDPLNRRVEFYSGD